MEFCLKKEEKRSSDKIQGDSEQTTEKQSKYTNKVLKLGAVQHNKRTSRILQKSVSLKIDQNFCSSSNLYE